MYSTTPIHTPRSLASCSQQPATRWKAAGIASLGSLLLAMVVSPIDAQDCSTKQFDSPLKSLSWPITLAPDQLLGIDGAAREIVQVDTEAGGVSSAAIEVINGRATFVAFAQAGSDIVQAYGNAEGLRIGWFSKDLQRKHELTYGEEALRNPNQMRLIAPYRFITTQGHLVGYGAINSPNDKQGFELGFFDQPLPMPGSAQIAPTKLFHPFGNPSFYLIGHPMMVAVGSRVVYLEMGATATLYQYDLALGLPPQQIRSLPGEDSLLDDPQAHMLGLARRERLMELLDAYEGPWGLYEQAGRIYLLTRQPTGDTSASWILRELVIDSDGYIDQKIASRAIHIPTKAQQIVLVASPEQGEWLVFEQTGKGDGRVIATMMTCPNLTPQPASR